MKSLIQSIIVVSFATVVLSACGAKEEAAAPSEAAAPAVAAPAPAAVSEPVKEEPGGWVPPPADAAPAVPVDAAAATPAEVPAAPAEAAK